MFFSLWKKSLIILIIFFTSALSDFIVMNFDKIKDIFSEDDDEVSLNILKNNIYCNITVGNQIIPFYISFDKELTFIVDDNYTFSKYEPKKSSKFQKKSEKSNNYIFDNLQIGFNASDTFSLKNEDNKKINIEDMPFILGTYLDEKNNFQFPAQLGLKKKTYENPQIFNFIENLKLKRIINSQVFFFKFDEGWGGKLIIGSYPHEYDENYNANDLIQSSSLEMGASNNWFLKINYLFIGENKIDLGKQLVELSPEYGMIILNLQIEKIIYDSFFKQLIEEKKCVRIKVQYNYNYICLDNININNFKNITFRHIGMEYDFIFEPKDLFYHYYDRYFFLISFQDTFYTYLGKPFFKKFTLIFNQDSKQVAIYSSYVQEENMTIINKLSVINPIILIIIFSVLVCIFLYALHVYRLKKRRINEIIENYDYTPEKSQNKNKNTKLLEIN